VPAREAETYYAEYYYRPQGRGGMLARSNSETNPSGIGR
jgi:hypothetical protein